MREIVPLRDTRSATVYYDYDGESGNPEAPVATCGTARSWLYRSTTGGTVSWMFQSGAPGSSGADCAGSLSGSLAFTPPGISTVRVADDPGEAASTSFGHAWPEGESDGHVLELAAAEFTLTASLGTWPGAVSEFYANGRDEAVVSSLDTPSTFTITSTLFALMESAVFDTGRSRDWG